jgi:hypothetical protein
MSAPGFPAGEYVAELNPSAHRRGELIGEIQRLPSRLYQLVDAASDAQLDTLYRNWTVRQIVHHLADSHANAYIRFRLALTEDRPAIKPYDETRWAALVDARTADVALSVRLLESLHGRWAMLLCSMTETDFERSYFHPEFQKEFRLAEVLGLYAHHCRHHTAQIAWVLQR